MARRRWRTSAVQWRRSLAGSHAFVLAGTLFLASAVTEVAQYFWPRGMFAGTFDPLDVAAYSAGLAVCCPADLRWPVPVAK